MLATLNRPQFVSRVFTDRYGRDYRLTFFITGVNGELKARLVSVEPVSGDSQPLPRRGTAHVLCLPFSSEIKAVPTEYLAAIAPIVSPYISLIYLVSQPTRAPARK